MIIVIMICITEIHTSYSNSLVSVDPMYTKVWMVETLYKMAYYLHIIHNTMVNIGGSLIRTPNTNHHDPTPRPQKHFGNILERPRNILYAYQDTYWVERLWEAY